MQNTIRNLALLSLTFPLVLTACSLPGNPPIDSAQESLQAKGELLVRFSGFEAQSLAAIEHVDLAVRMPGANFSHTKRVFAEDLQEVLNLSLKGIPVGSGEIVATMFMRDKPSILRKKQVQIDPGMSTTIDFDFFVSGDSATDLALEYTEDTTHNFYYVGPYDSDFWSTSYSYPSGSFSRTFELTAGATKKTITYQQIGIRSPERIIDGQAGYFSFSPILFFNVPNHATYVADRANHEGFGKVRHLQFTNSFKQGDVWKELTVDRYFAVEIGLVHEVVSEGGQKLSELKLISTQPPAPAGNE